MDRKTRSTVDKQRVISEQQNSSYLALLLKFKNITGICSLIELSNRTQKEAVRKAVCVFDADEYTIQKWQFAVHYFLGEKEDILDSRQAITTIIKELSKKNEFVRGHFCVPACHD